MKNRYHSLLLDTDVLIDYLRGQKQAVSFLENTDSHLMTSAINVAEIFAGVRDGEERKVLEKFIRIFEIINTDHEIAEMGGIYRRDYGQSHGTGLADAIIAASAKLKNARLVTLNARHFPMLPDIFIPYKKIS